MMHSGFGTALVERSAEAYVLRNAGVELAFRYIKDRWQHTLSLFCEGSWLRLISSQEGTELTGVPASPALQDLRLEELGDGIFEFQLLGQATNVVYSAAVRSDGLSRQIDWDVCARASKKGAALCTASRYRAGDPGCLAIEQRTPVALALIPRHGPPVELVPVAGADPQTECRLVQQEPIRVVVAGLSGTSRSEIAKRNTNVRWRYRLCWDAAAAMCSP